MGVTVQRATAEIYPHLAGWRMLMSSPTVLSADLKGKIKWWPQLLKCPGVRGQVPSKHWVCFNWNKRICWRLLLIDVTHKSRLEIANNCFKACLWACYRWVGLSAYYSIMPSKQEMDVKAWKTKCGHGGAWFCLLFIFFHVYFTFYVYADKQVSISFSHLKG